MGATSRRANQSASSPATSGRARKLRKELRGSVLDEEAGDLRRKVRELEEAKVKWEKRDESKRRQVKELEAKGKEAARMVRTYKTMMEAAKKEADRARKEGRRKEKVLEEAKEENRSLRKRVERVELDKAKAESMRPTGCSSSSASASGSSTSADTFFQDVLSNFKELVETNLQCSICNELFAFAATVSCGHSFCEECIEEWKAKKEEGRPNCPICRKDIRATVPNLVLDAYIDKAADNFFPEEGKVLRLALMDERKQKKRLRLESSAQGSGSSGGGGAAGSRRRRHPAGRGTEESDGGERWDYFVRRRRDGRSPGRSIRIFLSSRRRGDASSSSSDDVDWTPRRPDSDDRL